MNDSSVAAASGEKRTSFEAPLRYVSTLLAKREYAAVLLVFAALVGITTVLKTCEVRQQRGDTAIFFQVAENAAHRGVAVSQVFANTQAYLDSGLLTATADEIADDPLSPPDEKERNMLHFHAYYVFYAIAPLLWLFPSNVVLLLLQVLSFVGLLLVAYVMLRRGNVPAIAAALFGLLVVSHPAWGDALLYGQFYPDNLFVLAGFALMCLAGRQHTSRSALIAAAAACMLLGERAAITAGVFLLAYVALYWRQQNRSAAYFKAGLGALLVLYGILLVKVVLGNSAYSSFLPRNMTILLADLHNPAFVQKLLFFLLMNAALLLISAFNFRAAVIAVLLMLPNIFGNIGGAEKVGWASHYHAYYFPALVWAAMAGFEALYRKLAHTPATRWMYAGVAILLVLVNLVDADSFSPVSVSAGNVTKNFFFRLAGEVATDTSPAGAQLMAQTDEIRRAVPERTVVTTVEEGMPVLYRDRTIRFFPIAIDQADYAVLHFQRQGQQIAYSGAVDFLGPAELGKIDAVLTARMKRDGYDFGNAVLIPADGMSGIAVVKRLR